MPMNKTIELILESELREPDLNSIFKFCPDGVACKDTELNYKYVNNNYCKLFGLNTPEAVLGKLENIYLSENSRKSIHDADSEIKQRLYPINYIIDTNNKILNITSYPIVCKNEFGGIISIIKNSTQEEIIKEKFVNKHFQYVTAEKNLQAKRESFVATISHDLKNPTIAQIRSLELLLRGAFGELKPEQRELVEIILDSCRYMYGMLSSLLATYRNYGGVIKLNYEEFSITELVRECVSEMVYVAKDKDVKIKLNQYEPVINIKADIIQIKRVVMNLISNGIKYAYKGSDINLSIYVEDGFVIFQFENRSPYINEKQQKIIFDRYVTYSETGNELGTGLGLYVSKKIIECHGGKIFVKSFKDNRNIFGFKVPAERKCFAKDELII